MIDIEHLVAGYRDTTILHGVDLTIGSGEFVALLGRNGVGKTTLLRTIFGLCQVSEGTIELNGAPMKPGKPELAARRGFSFLPDDRGVFETLTVEENLRLARHRTYQPPVDIHQLFPLLHERASQTSGSLSGGQKQQLGIARAILAGHRFIAIDELSQGLQPNIAHTTMTALRQLVDSGISVVIVEQSPALPLQYCDRVIGMVKGTITFDQPIEQVRQTPDALNHLLVVT